MMKKIFCLAAVAALLVIGAAISQEAQEIQGKKPTADRHKDRGVTCGVCHDGETEPKAAASPKSCIMCKNHGSWSTVTERTDADNGYKFNPHHNHILEMNDLECAQCHQAHKDDTVVCYNCHQAMKFK